MGIELWRHLWLDGVTDLEHLLSMLESIFLSLDCDDDKLWSPHTEGNISVKSVYTSQVDDCLPSSVGWRKFWNKVVPL